jgi:hypothetical protein
MMRFCLNSSWWGNEGVTIAINFGGDFIGVLRRNQPATVARLGFIEFNNNSWSVSSIYCYKILS